MTTKAEGKTFMFTGRLSITRWEAQNLLTKAGGFAGLSVNRGTDYLVVGERPGSKLGKAVALGVETINEETFRELLKEEDLPVEEWSDNGVKVLTEETFLSVLQTLEARADEYRKRKEKEQKDKLETIYSFESPFVLSLLLKEHPWLTDRLDLSLRECTHCGATIPYVTDSRRVYCFNCHSRENELSHRCIYHSSDKLPSVGTGEYKMCIICGNLRFFEKAKFEERTVLCRKLDICNSAEYCLSTAQSTARLQKKRRPAETHHTRYSQEEIDTFLRSQYDRMTRKDEKRRQKYAQRRARRESLDRS